MIEIDGITIRRVVEIALSSETAFRAVVYFHQDSRIEDCSDLSALEEYGPQMWQEQNDEQIGIARIILPKETQINFQSA